MIKWLDEHFEETILVVLLVLIACVELIQVIIRNIPFIPALTWAEEFCRFCWIWSVFISLPFTIRKNSMLRVSVVLDLFPSVIRNLINVIVDLITTVAMAYLGVNAIKVVSDIAKSAETSPAMLWPMWIVYSIMLFGFFMGALRGVQMAVRHAASLNKGSLSTLEQTLADAKEEAETAKRQENIGMDESGKGGNDGWQQ